MTYNFNNRRTTRAFSEELLALLYNLLTARRTILVLRPLPHGTTLTQVALKYRRQWIVVAPAHKRKLNNHSKEKVQNYDIPGGSVTLHKSQFKTTGSTMNNRMHKTSLPPNREAPPDIHVARLQHLVHGIDLPLALWIPKHLHGGDTYPNRKKKRSLFH